MTPDVNVLVAASRSDHPHHKAARDWLRLAIAEAGGGRTLLLLPMVVASYLRLVTHRKIFVSPTPIDAALSFVDALLDLPGVSMPAIGDEWPRLREICLSKGLSANAIPDAWLAAAVREMGDHLVTFDADFKRLLSRGEYTLLDT